MRSEDFNPSGKRARRRRRFVFWGSCAAVAAFAGAAAWTVFFSGAFAVRSFAAEGSRLVAPEELKARAVERLDKRGFFARLLGAGNMLYWAGVDGVSADLDPSLASLAVEKNYASRTVRLRASERAFEGVWCAAREESETRCVGFDAEGTAFFDAPSAEGSLVLKVRDMNAPALELGKPVMPDAPALKNILDTVEELRKNGVRAARVTVGDASLREWELAAAGGCVMKFSLDFMPEDIPAVLAKISEERPIAGLQYVDFRVPNRAYYK